jgi:hypothetical protein
MDAETVRRAVDPFFTTRTTRHVGLGLPLLAAAAQRCEGSLTIESTPGRGTLVQATLRRSHIDRAPLGDLPGTLVAFLLGGDGQGPQLKYRHRLGDSVFELDTADLRAELGGLPLSYPPVREWLYAFVTQGEAGLASPSIGGLDAETEDD